VERLPAATIILTGPPGAGPPRVDTITVQLTKAAACIGAISQKLRRTEFILLLIFMGKLTANGMKFRSTAS
jgi:hypothetical protein